MRILLIISLVACLCACRKPRDTGTPHAVPVAADEVLDLRLLTANLRYENHEDTGPRAWSQRIANVVKAIRSEQPDLIGIQEALHGQAADLWASLPDYELHGVGRDDGKRAGEYAAILYRRDRFEADPAKSGTFWLSATPDVPGSKTWGNTIPRETAWLTLTDRQSGQKFLAYCTHWDHQNQPSREHAAMLIAEHIDAHAPPGTPVVLLGDFNSNESNPAIRYLTGHAVTLAGKRTPAWPHGLVDTFEALHASARDRTTLHFWANSKQGSRKVDHILVSQGAQILSAAIRDGDKPMVSDHFPVSAHVRFPKSSAN